MPLPFRERLEARLKKNTEDYERAIYFATHLLRSYAIPSSQCEAADLVQTAIERTWSGSRKWKDDKELLFHLFGVIRSLASRELAQKRRENAVELTPEMQETIMGLSADAEDYLARLQQLLGALHTLKGEQPELFDFFVELNRVVECTGLVKDSEIERFMGLKPKTISEKRRQVVRLFDRLNGNG